MKEEQTDYDLRFSKCFEQYSLPLTRYISSRLRDWDTAEEICQDLFSYLYETKRPLDISRSTTGPFLFTAARNRVIDHLRKKLKMIPASDTIDEIVPDESFFARVADGYCDGEVTGTLYKSLNELPDMHRRVIILSAYKGKGVRQISRELKTSEYMVNAALRCARGSLKESLAKYFPSS